MTDHELLELAAKAAGLRSAGRYDFQFGLEVSAPHNAPYQWNPLADDGDALRLAVTLKISLEFFNGFEEVRAADDSVDYSSDEEYGSDHFAATRRAIVRAAATLGAGMP